MEPAIYEDGPGRCRIANFMVGFSFGPMRFTPKVPESIVGRTYFGAIYSRGSSQKVADMAVEVIDAANGIIEASVIETEAAKVPSGTHEFLIWYTTATEKRPAYTGPLNAVYR